jgi:hypothetical protein
MEKNYGYLPIVWSDTHKVFGTDTGIARNISNSTLDWQQYYSKGEWQLGLYFDSMACVSFSANKVVEAIMNYQIAKGIMSQESFAWLSDNGYLTHGLVNLSDRFLAKVSGTTRQGNSGDKVANALRHSGAVPEAVWPFPREQRTPVFDWNDFYSEIPQKVINLGLEFVKRFNIQYEFVNTSGNKDMKESLVYAPLQAYVHAWEKPVNGIYQRSALGINHSISVFKPEWFIRDHYEDYEPDFDKQLAPDFLFHPQGVLYNVTDNKLTYSGMAKVLKDKRSSAVGVIKLAKNPAELVGLAKEVGINISEPINWNNTINGTYELKNNFMGLRLYSGDAPSRGFEFSKKGLIDILKVLVWSAASAIVASLIAILPQVDLPAQWVWLVPVINTVLVAIYNYIKAGK